MLDKNAGKFCYSTIPTVDIKKVIVPTKEILDIFKNHYLEQKKSGDKYWNKNRISLLESRYPGIDTSPYKIFMN